LNIPHQGSLKVILLATDLFTANPAMDNIKKVIVEEGYFIAPHFYSDKFVDEIIEQLNRHSALQYSKQNPSDFNLLTNIPFIKDLAHSQPLFSSVKQVIGENAFPANCFVLDKTLDNNWGLDWHQDLKIAVKNKIETVGYSNWTVECGIFHTIPPKEILEKRLSVRIHLDDCLIENGTILIAPKSHKFGILNDRAEIEKIIIGETHYCEIEKGGVMFITPLLLHKSPYSLTNKKRRILQIDYVATSLANGLEWYH
jgi:ectoine hydroxylase-related dioxygenase (phytanoyl-CoA dioxygenase family)